MGAQSDSLSPVQFSVQFTRNRGQVSTCCRFPTSEVFGMKIDAAYHANTFIFDDHCNTMWLCPTINLIIYLLRYYLTVNSYTPSEVDALVFPEGLENSRRKLKSLETITVQDGILDMYGYIISSLINR